MSREPLVVAVLGLGEAGSEIAAGLRHAGAVVRGFDPAATLDRLEQGSVRHALRRIDEMAAASEQLRGLGVPPRVAGASEQWLR